MRDDWAAVPPPTPDCAAYADDLPMLHDAGIPAAELTAARAHAATCPHCQAQLARYAALDAALRERFTVRPAGRELFTAEGIIRQAGGRDARPLRQPRWPALAFALGTVVLLIALIFVLLPRQHVAGSSTAPATPAPTPTLGLVIALCGNYQPFAMLKVHPYDGLRVGMTGPRDGWVVGTTDVSVSYLLHFQNGLWRQVVIPGDVGNDRVTLMNALGPNEVWFNVRESQDSGFLLHYLAGRWYRVDEPATVRGIYAFGLNAIFGEDDSANFWRYDGAQWHIAATKAPNNSVNETITMLAPDDGWAISDDFHAIWHWDGTTWRDATGPLPTLLWSLAFATPTDGWAGGNGPVYYHYHAGTWEAVPVSYDVYQAQAHFTMLSTTEGWVGGTQLLAHYQNGVWAQVPSPLGAYSAIYNLSFTAPNDGWAAATDTATRAPRLLHYVNGAWQVYDILTPICLGQ